MFYIVKLTLSVCGCSMIIGLCHTGENVVVDGVGEALAWRCELALLNFERTFFHDVFF